MSWSSLACTSWAGLDPAEQNTWSAGQLSRSSLHSSGFLHSPWSLFLVSVLVWLVPLFFFLSSSSVFIGPLCIAPSPSCLSSSFSEFFFSGLLLCCSSFWVYFLFVLCPVVFVRPLCCSSLFSVFFCSWVSPSPPLRLCSSHPPVLSVLCSLLFVCVLFSVFLCLLPPLFSCSLLWFFTSFSFGLCFLLPLCFLVFSPCIRPFYKARESK